MQSTFVRRTLTLCLALALLVGFAPPLATPMEAAQSPPPGTDLARQAPRQRALDAYLKLPLYFIANQGQMDGRVAYYAQSNGHSIYFTAEEVVMALDETVLRMRFVGNQVFAKKPGFFQRQPVGVAKRAAKVNYFIGSDPAKWRTDIPTYGEVVYHDLYPGIDLRYAGQRGALKYTFVVQPGADPSQIRLAYGGAAGLRLDEAGNLLILAARSELKDTKPYAYQEIGGRREEVETEFVLHGVRTYGFAVRGGYDPHYPLIIDPSLLYSTYLGGSKDDRGCGIAVDGSGNVYMAGNTWSTNFPTRNAYQGTYGGGGSSGGDVFVTKIDPTQSGAASLIYSTYLGGEYEDRSYDIAVDGDGNAYVTGNTRSEDFPITPNAYQTEIHDYDYPYPALGPSWNGSEHAFVTKLNAAGSELLYSTFLRGKNSWLLGDETGYGIAVYGADIAYVTGASRSSDFPTTPNAYQGTKAGDTTTHDVFFTKIDTTQSGAASLLYSTYLGGSETERGLGIAVDGVGNAYLTGQTYSSPDFPTQNAYQGTYSGDWDAIVVKFNAAGDALLYSTYLGGSDTDWGYGIAVDGAGHAYVAGETESNNFPTTPNAYQAANAGQADAFVVKIDATKSGAASLIYSTYLGGEGTECYYSGCAIAVDGAGHAYVTGSTDSSYFPTKNPYRDDSLWDDAFVTKFNASGSDLVYSTYLGGNGSDGGTDIALDGEGNAYVSGMTMSTKFFDTKNPYQATNAGQVDAFVVVLGPDRPDLSTSSKQVSPATIVPTGTVTHTLSYTITLANTGSLTATTAYLTDTLPSGLSLTVGPVCSDGTCNYNAPHHTVTWTGSLAPSASVVITYAGLVSVPIGTGDTTYFVNTAVVDDGINVPFTLRARSAVNPQDSYLPLIQKH